MANYRTCLLGLTNFGWNYHTIFCYLQFRFNCGSNWHVSTLKVHQKSVIIINNFRESSERYMKYYYAQPYTRCGPYFIGMLFGWLIYKLKTDEITLNKKTMRQVNLLTQLIPNDDHFPVVVVVHSFVAGCSGWHRSLSLWRRRPCDGSHHQYYSHVVLQRLQQERLGFILLHYHHVVLRRLRRYTHQLKLKRIC